MFIIKTETKIDKYIESFIKSKNKRIECRVFPERIKTLLTTQIGINQLTKLLNAYQKCRVHH